MIGGRPLALAGLLGAAVGGPYVLSQAPDGWAPNKNDTPPKAEAAAEKSPADLAQASPDLSSPTGPGSDLYDSPAQLAGPVGMPLEQALDWNVNRNWVYRHWARKSTGLADPTLFGVRVPLVTGAGMTDVAGSLTYYFDGSGVLQRMRLAGRTADTSRIVHLAATRFGMQAVTPVSPGDQLMQAREGKRLRGELRTRPEGTLWATSPHTSFDVRFEATRPGGDYVVTPETPRLEIPQVASAAPPEPAAVDEGQPVLPPRAIVPDRPPKPAGAAEAGAPAAQSAPVGGPPTPKLPKLGSPTAAPPPAMKPLGGYRERFRWPG